MMDDLLVGAPVSATGWTAWAASLLLFLLYYAWRYLAVGAVTIDVWFVFYYVVLQNFLMIPMGPLYVNELLTGYGDQYIAALDEVVLISSVGALAFMIGAWVGRWNSDPPIGFLAITRAMERVWLTPRWYFWGAALCLPLIAILMAKGAVFGQARLLALVDPSAQVLNNLLNAVAQLMVLVSIVYWYKTRTWTSVLGVGFALACSLFGGTRTASFWPLILAVVTLLHYRRYRGLIPLAFLAGAIVWGAVAYAAFRNAAEDDVRPFLVELLIGGHLTEQRDFAWVYAAWNGRYLDGMSMLAGLLGFIPSSMSAFRSEWGWAKYTANLTGIDPEVFPGFRLPIFGEPFFNFSYAGVLAWGFLFGFIVFRVSRILDRRDVTIYHFAAAAVYLNLVQLMLVSVTIFVVYVQVALLVVSAFVRRLTWVTSARA